jgi:hypothetical protein
MQIRLTYEDIKVIEDLIFDWGCDYGLKSDRVKIIQLARKIKMDEDYIKNYLEV